MPQVKKKKAPKLSMNCPFPFCDGFATVQACKGKKIRGAKHQDYYWLCDCQAKGYFTEEHYKRLDKSKKISIATG